MGTALLAGKPGSDAQAHCALLLILGIAKLRAENRREAAAIAARLGLV
jgi:DNA-binding CsgD family transcriptional regulator